MKKIPLVLSVLVWFSCALGPTFAQNSAPPSSKEKTAQKLLVEWKHLDQFGQTCIRCTVTGKTLVQVIEEMKTKCASQGVEIVFVETRLTVGRLGESNQILFNGTPLENLLPGAKVFESDCPSCASLTGQPSCCRGIEVDRKKYEDIPEELIWQAACKILACEVPAGKAPAVGKKP